MSLFFFCAKAIIWPLLFGSIVVNRICEYALTNTDCFKFLIVFIIILKIIVTVIKMLINDDTRRNWQIIYIVE